MESFELNGVLPGDRFVGLCVSVEEMIFLRDKEFQMKRVPVILTALGSAVMMGVALPASAQASTGVFSYTHAYSRLPVVLVSPADAKCIAATAFGDVTNGTDKNVTLFPSPACQGEPLGTLGPDGKAADMAFASVIFTAP